MSIDYLFDLERDIEGGRDVYATPGVGRNQWILGKSVDELRRPAKKTADHKKTPVQIVRLIPKSDAITGQLFLVPTKIGEPGTRGEPQIEWSPIETKEAAEVLRDVRRGPSPFFAMQVEETVSNEG